MPPNPKLSFADHDKLVQEVARGGMSAEMGGRVIGSGKAAAGLQRQAAEPPAAAPEPARPTTPPPSSMTEPQVRAALAECDARWAERADSLQRQIDLLTRLVSMPRQAPTWQLQATEMDADGRITELIATPRQAALN